MPAPFVYTKLTKTINVFGGGQFVSTPTRHPKFAALLHTINTRFWPTHRGTGAHYHGLDERDAQMDNALERALAQAENDATFKKVKRMSYSSNAAGEVSRKWFYKLKYYYYIIHP